MTAPAAAAAATPQVAVNPTSALGGTAVTINGTGFAAGQPMAIRCDNKTVATTPAVIVSDASGSFSTTIKGPTGQPGVHSLQVSDGAKAAVSSFQTTIEATISKTTSATAPGNVGMELKVSGGGFVAGAMITVTTDSDEEVKLASAGADDSGNFETTFTVPPIEGGQHVIEVTDGANTRQFTFVMESRAPAVPVLLGPKPGAKADRPVSFQWKAVTDPSGVTYNLQLDTSANFTDPLLDKAGLTSPGYALTEGESLKSVIKETPYYWRVQAIDGAGNQSAWSEPVSFYLGFVLTLPNGESALTLSAMLVYLTAAIIVGLLILSYWLGRRSRRPA